MLYAKISPPAQIVVQDGPFATKVEEAEFVAITAQNYKMGDDPSRFIVMYGHQIYSGDTPIAFRPKYQIDLMLDASDIARWGDDDSVMFDIIGEKQGFEVIEIIDTNLNTTTTTTTSL